jgi:hypothetical protein
MPLIRKLPDCFTRAGVKLPANEDLLAHQLNIARPGGAYVCAVREDAAQERANPAPCVF